MEIALMEQSMKIKMKDMEIEQLKLEKRQRDNFQEYSDFNSSSWRTF